MSIDFVEKVRRTAERYCLLEKGDRVVVGLSGGADSTALLEALYLLKEQYSLSLFAAHINHGIRGEEADRDEAFAEDLAKQRGIPFLCLKADAPAFAREHRIGLEEAGRRIRYDFFERCAEGGKIATAHTLSDNAETVLLHLSRGTGTAGLCGIPPKRDNIIRPLISCSRSEVEAFCKERGLGFVTDSTNKCDDYSRNFIRNNIVPLFKKLNPEFEGAVFRASDIAAKEQAFLEGQAQRALLNCAATEKTKALNKETFDSVQGPASDGSGNKENPSFQSAQKPTSLDNEKLLALDEGLRMRVLKLFLEELFPESTVDYALVRRLCDGVKSGRTVNLKNGKKAVFKNGALTVVCQKEPPAEPFYREIDLLKGDAVIFAKGKRVEIRSEEKIENSEINGCQKINSLLSYSLLDRDKISNTVILRTRLSGDKITLKKRGCTKTLKKLWNEKKFTEKQRQGFLVLESDCSVVFSEPDGANAENEAERDTKNILSVKIFAEE